MSAGEKSSSLRLRMSGQRSCDAGHRLPQTDYRGSKFTMSSASFTTTKVLECVAPVPLPISREHARTAVGSHLRFAKKFLVRCNSPLAARVSGGTNASTKSKSTPLRLTRFNPYIQQPWQTQCPLPRTTTTKLVSDLLRVELGLIRS